MGLTDPRVVFAPRAQSVTTLSGNTVQAHGTGADIPAVQWEGSSISWSGLSGTARLTVIGEWNPPNPGALNAPTLVDLSLREGGAYVALGRWLVVATDTDEIRGGTTITTLLMRDIAAQLELQLRVPYELAPGANVFAAMQAISKLGFSPFTGGGWHPVTGIQGVDPGAIIPPGGVQWTAGSTTLRGMIDELAALAGMRSVYPTRTGGLVVDSLLDPADRTVVTAWGGDNAVLRPRIRWNRQRALAPNAWDYYNSELSVLLGEQISERLTGTIRTNFDDGPASQVAAGWISRHSRGFPASDAAALERRIAAAATVGTWATVVSGMAVPWSWTWVGDVVSLTQGSATGVPVEITDWTLPLAAHLGDLSWSGNQIGAGA